MIINSTVMIKPLFCLPLLEIHSQSGVCILCFTREIPLCEENMDLERNLSRKSVQATASLNRLCKPFLSFP